MNPDQTITISFDRWLEFEDDPSQPPGSEPTEEIIAPPVTPPKKGDLPPSPHPDKPANPQ